jgi:catalase-peroxidase
MRTSTKPDTMENPLAAVQMGLIYVNPEGVNGSPTRSHRRAGARDLRPDGDERRGNRRADRGRPHRRQGARQRRCERWVPSRKAAAIENQGFGWMNPNMGGKATNAVTSGIEGAWTTNPTKWDMGYFELLFGYDWELTKSPAGANQWRPVDIKEEDMPVDRPIRPSVSCR